MSQTEAPKVTRRQHITREEEADRCLNHTVYSKGSQLMAAFMFLAIVFGVPIAQHVVEIKQNLAKQAAWSPSSGAPKPGLAPQIYDVFKLLPTSQQISQAKGFWGYWDLIPSVESISAFETSLKENSVLTTSLLSPTQQVMTGLLGAGNEKAYVGRDGWLFYRPDVEYLTSPGFLTPSWQKEQSHGATAIQPDPVKAILDFKEQLASRGIQLVVMPMSTKPMIHPEMLAGWGAEGEVLQNDSFAQFQQTLESNGVHVFDPTPVLLDLKKETGSKLYLQSDTHWTPEAMDRVASKLGEFLNQKYNLPYSPGGYGAAPQQISNLGDIAEMLKLPKDQTIFLKQTVTIKKIAKQDGSPWAPERTGDVLLLGDSFSNIYSLDGMGWGSLAGFAEHLSFALARPIDKIVINAGGAFASRRELARQLAQGVDRLANKKVVVYEFSMRDLSQGDWKMIKLAQPPKATETIIPPTPPVTSKPNLNPSAGLTFFKALKATPNTLDLSKHDVVHIEVTTPPGSWNVTIVNTGNEVIRRLSGGTGTIDHKLEDHWDGKDVRGKAVPAGSYTVRVEGTRLDGTKIAPLLTGIVVVDAAQKTPVTLPPTKVGGTTPKTGAVPPNVTPPKTNTTTPVKPIKPVEQGLFVTGRIASRATTPKPGSVPYKDCLIALQLTDLKVTGGTVKGPNIVVYVWGMRDNQLVDGAYTVGQTIRFKLAPWASVESKYGGYNRQELEADDAISWEAFWGEISK